MPLNEPFGSKKRALRRYRKARLGSLERSFCSISFPLLRAAGRRALCIQWRSKDKEMKKGEEGLIVESIHGTGGDGEVESLYLLKENT